MDKKLNKTELEELLEKSRKLRMIYITCARIAVDLYTDQSDNFIKNKAKEFYKLACAHNPYIEKRI